MGSEMCIRDSTLTRASVICGQAGTTVQLRRRVARAAQLVPA